MNFTRRYSRKHSKRGRGTKKLNTEQREKREYAREFKKLHKYQIALEKKIVKLKIKQDKLVEKRDKDEEKIKKKIDDVRGDIHTNIDLLYRVEQDIEESKKYLSYSGLELLK
tara:strand:+ start:1735 stop:2070 length:336 start_codon:yes stop_codon:yes gene_type:complete